MADASIFPAFAKLAYQPDDGARSGFLRSLSETVDQGNRKLTELGRGLDPLAGMSTVMKRQLDELTNSLRKGAGADLGTAAAKEAAAVAGLRAAAARDLAAATEQVARATGDESREAQSAIAAARALAAQEELAAKAARDHAAALGLVQGQLDKVAAESGLVGAAIGRTAAANDNAGASAGRFRAGAQQLGFQISDLGVQLSAAANSTHAGKLALTAFGQQIPQVVQAVALMRGEAGGLVGFLSGPWGAALIAGGTLLGTLALAHYDAANASEVHKAAAEDLAKAIDELHAATVRESRSTQASIADDIDKANALKLRAQEARKAAIAELQLAQQKARGAGASVSIGAPSYSNLFNVGEQGKQEANARDIQATIDKLNADIGKANETIRLKRGSQIRQSVREGLDASASATGKYERAMDSLNSELQAGTISEARYRAEVTRAEAARESATAGARKSSATHRAHAAAVHADADAAKAAKVAFADLARILAPKAKAGVEAFDAKGAADYARMVEQIGQHRDAMIKPAQEAADAAAQWRENLQGVLSDLEQIGGLSGTLGKVASALTGRPNAIGGAGGVVLRNVLGAQWTGTDAKGDRIIYKLGEQLEDAFGKRGSLAQVLASASLGSASGTLFLGQSGNNLGSAIGGVVGEKAGAGIGKALGGLGKSLGGPLGSILGGVLGGAIGSLFASRPRGSGAVTNSGVTTSANNSGIKGSLDSFGLGLQSTVAQIADQLGGSVGNYSVGIGKYRDYYQVSNSANDRFLGQSNYWKKSSQDLYDGKDAEAAMRAAIKNAIADGAIQGVRAGTQALLNSGTDIQRQLQKALDFESVFKRLQEFTDPVGAAIDGVNRDFTRLKETFGEAGASAAELADLEKLYGIERAKAAKAAADSMLGSLRDLRDGLTIGSATRSLRDREAAALAAYQPLEAKVRAGDTSAFDDYRAAAEQLLEIDRQLYGSQSKYFEREAQVLAITNAAIGEQQSKIDAATNRDSPFTKTGAAVNDNVSVTSAIDRQTRDLLNGLGSHLDALNSNMGTLIRTAQAAGGAKVLPDYSRWIGRGNF